jgi:hypothetical protein
MVDFTLTPEEEEIKKKAEEFTRKFITPVAAEEKRISHRHCTEGLRAGVDEPPCSQRSGRTGAVAGGGDTGIRSHGVRMCRHGHLYHVQ